MVLHYIMSGLFIGLIFGMPMGAIGALSIQRTMTYGPMAGFISGAASSLADVLYACIGAFGFTVISDFLLKYQLPIHLIGSIILIGIAIQMITKKEQFTMISETNTKEYTKMFLSSFAIAITNPAAILSFLFAFSVFNINGTLGFTNGVLLVVGVAIGTLCWWLLLVIVVNHMKQKLNAQWLHRLNILFGMFLILFGCCVTIMSI